MDFKLIKYYDTCCEECGNWASGDIGARELSGNKQKAEKALKDYGWKVIKGKVICYYCINGIYRM